MTEHEQWVFFHIFGINARDVLQCLPFAPYGRGTETPIGARSYGGEYPIWDPHQDIAPEFAGFRLIEMRVESIIDSWYPEDFYCNAGAKRHEDYPE